MIKDRHNYGRWFVTEHGQYIRIATHRTDRPEIPMRVLFEVYDINS